MRTLISIFALLHALSLQGDINVVVGQPASAPAGPTTFLIEETFDTNPGYDLSWTEQSGSPDEDYTTTILEGTESIYVNGTAASVEVRSPVLTDQTALWGYFLIRPLTFAGGSRAIMRFRVNGGNAGSSEIRLTATGQLIIVNGTSATAATVATMSIGSTYHVFWYVEQGTGADAEAWIAFSTDGTVGTGNNFTSRVNANGVTAFDQVSIFAQFSTTGPEYIMDRVILDDAPIGANP